MSRAVKPMTVTPLSLYWAWSSARWGMNAIQGPHQVAQNSTTYTLPGSNPLTSSPWSHLVAFSGGAGSPPLSDAVGLSFFEGPFVSWAMTGANGLPTPKADRAMRCDSRTMGRPLWAE